MTHTLPLQLRTGHLYVELGGELWLLDTGAPTSFGAARSLTVAGERFDLDSSYLGLTVATLSECVGVQCAGLLGANVLGRFDHVFDIPGGKLTMSTAELTNPGGEVPLDEFMGIPIVHARIRGNDYRMFFDTGAQLSYFQDASLNQFQPAGSVADFYPSVGQFQTDTYYVPVSLGGITFTLRCGTLPGPLGMMLLLASTQGILGNELLRDRIISYSPRRSVMVLGTSNN